MSMPSVLISILNWNNAEETINCIESLQGKISSSAYTVEVAILDNGSTAHDYRMLCERAAGYNVRIDRQEVNLGFTGGHNISIKRAIDDDFTYIWLLNNDATVKTGCLDKLVGELERDCKAGAVSPVIDPRGGGEPTAAWGGIHQWTTLETVWFTSEQASRKVHVERPDEIFVAGTANLIRVEALRQIGGLDDRLFAYYDDSDLGVRLANGGWSSKVVFDAAVEHGWRTFEQLPKTVLYLLYRNELMFMYQHTPPEYRRLLWLKLVDFAIYKTLRLKARGMHPQADAALLGISDFIFKKHGRPELNRTAPVIVRLAQAFLGCVYRSKLSRSANNP